MLAKHRRAFVLTGLAHAVKRGAPDGPSTAFVDLAGNLNCYGLQRGERRWSVPWQHRRKDHLLAAMSSRGLLAVGTDNGRLSVFDLGGNQLWSKVVAKRIQTNIAWLDDQTIVAGTTTALVAIRPPLPQR